MKNFKLNKRKGLNDIEFIFMNVIIGGFAIAVLGVMAFILCQGVLTLLGGM